MNTTISFPGLGIEDFTISRVAFSVLGRDVYWYGVIIMLGMVAAFIHAYFRVKQEGIQVDDILDVGIFTVFCGIIGARLYYVLTTLDTGHYKTFIDVIAVWDGGLAIYGGIIAGALAILGVTYYKRINTLKVMDTVAPGVMLAQAMGRWGNFVNGEAFGYEVAEGSFLYPFRMGVNSSFTGFQTKYVHPTFLYESLWNLTGFILITIFYRKKKFNGQVALAYITWYGFGRMFIEGLRTDSLYVGPFRISQVVGAACFIVGVGLMIAGLVATGKGKLDRWLAVSWAAPATANGAPAEDTDLNEAAAEDMPAEDMPASDESDESEPQNPSAEPAASDSAADDNPTEEN